MQEGKTTDGKEVRYTRKGENLYAVIMNEKTGDNVSIKDLTIPENAVLTLLGSDEVLEWKQSGDDLSVTLPADKKEQFAYTIKIAG